MTLPPLHTPSPYLAKCKRLCTDGPTPCLCCPGECVGDWAGYSYEEALMAKSSAAADSSAQAFDGFTDALEEAEDRMHEAADASRRHRQRSLAIGCALPAVLLIVLWLLAMAAGHQ